MITFTGVQMHPGCGRSPMVKDIAVGMCRITRYAGALWCPLAAHSLLVAEFSYLNDRDDFMWACGLLHDAHEVVTGEITRHYKPKEMKAHERELDKDIFAWLNLNYERYLQSTDFIKQMDEKALCAESTHLGLKHWPEYYRRMEGHDIAPLTETERYVARLVLEGGWRSSIMVEEDSPQQRKLTEVFEAIQGGRIADARRAVSILELVQKR